MKKLLSLVVLSAAFLGSAFAAPQTVTLSIAGMTCSACPITVKTALNKIDGVSKIDFSFQKLEATVTFDYAKTDVQALTKATGDAGFPSTVKK